MARRETNHHADHNRRCENAESLDDLCGQCYHDEMEYAAQCDEDALWQNGCEV